MPLNKSENKIRVTRSPGMDCVLGFMDPHVNMKVKFGIDFRWITGLDSGNFQVGLALASGGTTIAKAYPHQLIIDAPVASGYGWPTTGGSHKFTHESGIGASGPPTALGNHMVFLKGDGSTNDFTRG